MMDEMIEAGCATCPWRKYLSREPLGEYPPAAENGIAKEPPRCDNELNNPPRQREI
jgi:hypothetical protein